MGYINRLTQLEVTIKTIIKSKHKNFEIIIVNDGNEDLNFLIEKYKDYEIKIIDNHEKEYINPCMTYNNGINIASGDIILLQNPECCHVGDILTTINTLLKENNYLAFSCYYLDNYKKNDVLTKILFENENKNKNKNNFWNEKKIKDLLRFTLDYSNDSTLPKSKKGWCSHHYYNPNYLHFCSAIYKSDLIKIGNFSDDYKNGICFDDDDLVRKIILNKFKLSYFHIPDYPESYPC